jgi:hypothetical protein
MTSDQQSEVGEARGAESRGHNSNRPIRRRFPDFYDFSLLLARNQSRLKFK